jgi:osmotically-inducible protein OsmY
MDLPNLSPLSAVVRAIPFHPMKTFLILLLGILIGVLGWQYYQRTYHPTLAQRAGDAVDRTKDVATDTKEKATLSAKELGGHIEDAGIITLIKGKYVMDKDLSALGIGVTCRNGMVNLTGSVASPDLATRAVEIARQTKGVTNVTSQLAVKN